MEREAPLFFPGEFPFDEELTPTSFNFLEKRSSHFAKIELVAVRKSCANLLAQTCCKMSMYSKKVGFDAAENKALKVIFLYFLILYFLILKYKYTSIPGPLFGGLIEYLRSLRKGC